MAQTRVRKSVRNRLKTLQNREEIAERMDKMKKNRNLQMFLLLLLPVAFLIFGMLVFPPWGMKDETKIKTVIETVGAGKAEAAVKSEDKAGGIGGEAGAGGGAGQGGEGGGGKGWEGGDGRGGEGGGGRGGEREDEGKNGKQDDVKEGEKRQKRSIEKTEDHVEKSKDNVETGSAKEDRTVLKQVAEGKSDFKQKGRSADAMRKEDKSSQKKASTVGDQRLRVEDTKKYKPTIQRSLKIGNFELQGKNIKAEELKPSKSHNSSVRVYKFENFLTERECNGLIQAHKRHVLEFSDVDPIFCCDDISTIEKNVKDAGGKIAISAADLIPETTCLDTKYSEELKSILRWSYSTAFYPGESPFTRVFEERVKQATGLKPSNGGKFQITSYEKGVGYKTHTDCIVGNSDLRDRMGTILVYLDDVPLGGETSFPELGIKVTPKKGMALVWNNMNPDGICEPLSVHTAAKVQEGHKYIIQRWYYHQSFANLGQRAPEPPVPERLPKTARVTCDEYEHGSCRWYDEWNYDHIPDYLQRMNSLS